MTPGYIFHPPACDNACLFFSLRSPRPRVSSHSDEEGEGKTIHHLVKQGGGTQKSRSDIYSALQIIIIENLDNIRCYIVTRVT